MHKKFTAFCLPVLGSLVIVGAGFSAWVFNNELIATSTVDGDIVVTPVESDFIVSLYDGNNEDAVIAKSNSTVSNSLFLTLDQGGFDATGSVVDKGITWGYGANAGDVKPLTSVKLEFSFGNNSNLDALFQANDLKIEYTVTLTFSEKINTTYVVMKDHTDNTFTDTTVGEYNAPSAVVATVENLDLTLKYKPHSEDGGKPTSTAEHSAMIKALYGESSVEHTDGADATIEGGVKLEITASAKWTAKI